MNLVRSVSGTWHVMADGPTHQGYYTTACHRMVKGSKTLIAWDVSARRWPGVKTCHDCGGAMGQAISAARARRRDAGPARSRVPRGY